MISITNRQIYTALLIVFTALFLTSNISADSTSVGLGEFGIKLGQLRGCTVEYWLKSNESNVDSVEIEAGFSGGAFLDHPFYRNLHITASFDFHQISKDWSSEVALDVAGGLKFKWTEPNGRLSVRPAATVGFALFPNMWHFSASKYVTLKLYLEVASYSKRGTGLLLEIGSLRTLSGSDNLYEISTKPMLLVRAGIIW